MAASSHDVKGNATINFLPIHVRKSIFGNAVTRRDKFYLCTPSFGRGKLALISYTVYMYVSYLML